MTPTSRQIGVKLTKLRKTRKLSRRALAEAAGCSREYIRQLEAGTSDPTVGMLQRIAKALGVPVAELLE